MLLFSAARGSDPVLTSVLALLFVLPAVLALVVALRYLRAGDDEEEQEGLVGLGKVS
jgi:ABC-type enterobactin transport system permease subunit